MQALMSAWVLIQVMETLTLSRHDAQASAWERSAVLTEAQERTCDAVSEQCAFRPMPAHVSDLPPKLVHSTVQADDIQGITGALLEIMMSCCHKWSREGLISSYAHHLLYRLRISRVQDQLLRATQGKKRKQLGQPLPWRR